MMVSSNLKNSKYEIVLSVHFSCVRKDNFRSFARMFPKIKIIEIGGLECAVYCSASVFSGPHKANQYGSPWLARSCELK